MTETEPPIDYFKLRMEAAEAYIAETPCDPNVTRAQLKAYEVWQEIVSMENAPTRKDEGSRVSPQGTSSANSSEITDIFDQGTSLDYVNGYNTGMAAATKPVSVSLDKVALVALRVLYPYGFSEEREKDKAILVTKAVLEAAGMEYD